MCTELCNISEGDEQRAQVITWRVWRVREKYFSHYTPLPIGMKKFGCPSDCHSEVVICHGNTVLSSKDQEGKQDMGTWSWPHGGSVQTGGSSQNCFWRSSLV